ncbi:MAG: hypothetical protein JWL78_1318 [Chloroflexi bacterium]|jgi:hypothetical protein|nr:hypothetical protein [Chloroflexota bacterium]MEA2616179.1 hypothetical protein [Chloroflexota bacterium]
MLVKLLVAVGLLTAGLGAAVVLPDVKRYLALRTM